MSEIALLVSGVRFAGWTEISVSVSIETACRSFSLTATRTAGAKVPPIQVGAECEVQLDGVRLIRGVVGVVRSSRGDGARLSVTGRSLTREIVDCSADHKGRWSERTVAQIAAELCAQVGVEVVSEANAPKLGRFATKKGETIYSAIERAARERSLLLTDDADGRLVLTRAGTTRAGTIERGVNILASEVTVDAEQRYSEVRCRGQRAGDDADYGNTLFADETAADDGVDRPRLLIVEPEGRADAAACAARARWEVATRYGRSISLSYTVPGWTRQDGTIWTPNVLTRVIDPDERIDGTFLLHSVTYRRTEGEYRAELGLSPVEAYQQLSLPTLKVRAKPPGEDLLFGPGVAKEAADVARKSIAVGAP